MLPSKGLNVVTLRQLVTHIPSALHTRRSANLTSTTMSQISTKESILTFHLPSTHATPISKKMMVTTGTKHALNCGIMTLAWQEWKHCPLLDHTWNNWKDHWMTAFAEMRDINRMTSGDSAFANQAAAQEIVQAEKWLHC
jgi:hypothetical protein